MIEKAELLENAAAAVRERGRDYGPVKKNFENIARRWNAHMRNRYGDGVELDALDVAAMCADIKLARLAETPTHADSWLDIAGYAACGGEIASIEREQPSKWQHKPLKRPSEVVFPSGLKPEPAEPETWLKNNDRWVECLLGDCPLTLDVGDWVRHKDGTEGWVIQPLTNLPLQPENISSRFVKGYKVVVEGREGDIWFPQDRISAHKRDAHRIDKSQDVDDGWTDCSDGSCPLDLKLGDRVKAGDFGEREVWGPFENRMYPVSADPGSAGRLSVGLEKITAYKRHKHRSTSA